MLYLYALRSKSLQPILFLWLRFVAYGHRKISLVWKPLIFFIIAFVQRNNVDNRLATM